MIPNVKSDKLVAIYLYICDIYDSELRYTCKRITNNDQPVFTDQEIMTIYLFSMHCEQRFKIKHIHEFANDYLKSWFPKLPSYNAFNLRLNRLSEAFNLLISFLLTLFKTDEYSQNTSIIDSMPIVTCSGKRSPKVALELVDKTKCSSKSMWYHGVKLHVLAFNRDGKLPVPESIIITQASENDLNVFKQNWAVIQNRRFFGDKIYHDIPFFDHVSKNQNLQMYTPVKRVKNKPDLLDGFDKAADHLFSKRVSSIRQPIESFFNWLIEKTDIQRASKVRSTKGLLVHIFGRIAAAYINLIF